MPCDCSFSLGEKNMKFCFKAAALSCAALVAVSATAAGNRHVNGEWSIFGTDYMQNAVEHKDGSVTGSWNYGSGSMGIPDCIYFEGDGMTATVSGMSTSGFGYDDGFIYHMSSYTDNGEGKNAPADTTSYYWYGNFPEFNCMEEVWRVFVQTSGSFAITGGNVQVKD
jgi:hypothetical protein